MTGSSFGFQLSRFRAGFLLSSLSRLRTRPDKTGYGLIPFRETQFSCRHRAVPICLRVGIDSPGFWLEFKNCMTPLPPAGRRAGPVTRRLYVPGATRPNAEGDATPRLAEHVEKPRASSCDAIGLSVGYMYTPQEGRRCRRWARYESGRCQSILLPAGFSMPV